MQRGAHGEGGRVVAAPSSAIVDEVDTPAQMPSSWKELTSSEGEKLRLKCQRCRESACRPRVEVVGVGVDPALHVRLGLPGDSRLDVAVTISPSLLVT